MTPPLSLLSPSPPKHPPIQPQESRTVPNPEQANKDKRLRRVTKENTLSKWGGMKRGGNDNDSRQALKLLRWSNYLSGESFHRPDKEPLPEFYEFAVDVGSKTNINAPYEQPKKRKNIAASMVKSILKTEQAQQMLKEHQQQKGSKAALKEKSKLRRNKSKRNAKQRKRSGAGL